MQGGVGWQGIIPSRAAKMGSDRGGQGHREGRQPGRLLRAARAGQDRRAHPRELARATSATWSSASWSASTRSSGTTCRRSVREARARSASRSSCPEIVHDVTDEIGENIDQLLDIKLMVIRHIEEHPELANRIFRETGRQELRFIINFGFFFGFVLRHPAWRSSPSSCFRYWWVLPIGGRARRLHHQLARDLDDLRADRAAARSWASRSQGLFLQRQHEVADVYAEVIADDIVTLQQHRRGAAARPALGPHPPDDRRRRCGRRSTAPWAARGRSCGWRWAPRSTTRSASRWRSRRWTTR